MPIIRDNFLESTLGLFLDSHRVIEKGDVSFRGMGAIKGEFFVNDEEYPKFLDLLHDYLFKQNKSPLNLIELPRADLYKPLLIDLDFKYSVEQKLKRMFNLTHIHTFIHKYVENLTHFYNLDDYKPLRFFITLRPAPYEINRTYHHYIRDGVHIECPDLVLHSKHQQELRKRSIELLNLTNTFKNTGYINAEEEVFDECVVKTSGWFFYGESKPNIPPYNLTSIYVYNPKTKSFYEEEKDKYTSRQLLEILSIRYSLNVSIPYIADHEDLSDVNTTEPLNLPYIADPNYLFNDNTTEQLNITTSNPSGIISYIKCKLEPNDNSIAKLFAMCYKDKFCITAENGKEKWFKFDGTRWVTSNGIKYDIKNHLSDIFSQYFKEASQNLREEIMLAADYNYKNLGQRLSTITKMKDMLYSNTHKSRIIKELEARMYVEELPNISKPPCT